ncbi:glycosyl hydrolase [Tritrichomonas foetus]|uniref:alpha-mannosidase n=1 Tax=Tritrichomonas foetus TaxID=1144522 RepID=A0A1J4JK26_9EUKA|nr:glycosyl hydrolase [Tritrichomonas foetus]|eukprot:OHS99498.1 glycosyl hydrolase [Tritrichomonas foetus]
MILFSFLFSGISALYVVDPKHTITKIRKYYDFLSSFEKLQYKCIREGKFAKNADDSHKLPSECDYEWEEKDFSHGDFMFEQGSYHWHAFRGTMQVPDGYDPEKHLLKFHFGITVNYQRGQNDDNQPDGPEGRYWFNGKPCGARDNFHDGLFMTDDEAKDGVDVQVRIFNGRIPTHHKLDHFGIQVFDKTVYIYRKRVSFLLDLINVLGDTNPDKQKLIDILDESVRLLDIRDECSNADLVSIRKQDPKHTVLRESVPLALDLLLKRLSEMPKSDGTEPCMTILGYSHIDTMWKWPYNITHFKTTNTASTMLHLLEHPPSVFENPVEWKFLATAPQHYKWMEEDSPEVFNMVREMAKKGRWDVNGVMWLEPDTTLPSGESLNRQILYGYRYFEKHLPEFNSTCLFLPDCFGYTASLPQILRNGEADSFVTSKLSWNEYNTFPYSSFNWKGIDGSFVYAHFITTPSGSDGDRHNTYTGTSSVNQIVKTYSRNFQRDIIRTSSLHTSGHGDGGGGITEDMVWNYNMYNELPRIQGIPRLKFKSLDQIMDELREHSSELPTWDDELYLEFHRGTLTSFEEIKRQNRMLESHLHNIEWIMTLCYTLDAKEEFDPRKYQQEIQPIWEDTLLMHFHDTIPGSSINEANLDCINRGKVHLNKLRDLEKELGSILASFINISDNERLLFNTLSHDRYVHKQLVPSGGWAIQKEDTVLEKDEMVTTFWERKVQDESDHEHFIYNPFLKTIYPPVSDEKVKIIQIDENHVSVETPFFYVLFDENGRISSVTDKETGMEYLDQPGNAFELYDDRSYEYPAWELTLNHKEQQLPDPIFDGYDISDSKIVTKFHIPLLSEGGKANVTRITQTITFSPVTPNIDFSTVVEWTQHDKILKIRFPTNIRARYAKYGIQFGFLERPTHNNTSIDRARFEAAGRWIDLGEDGRGVAMMADTKNGWDIHENVIRLTLLKAPMSSDRWEDFGIRKFNYRVIFHNTSFVKSHISQAHDELNVPPVQIESSSSTGTLEKEHKFVEVEDINVILDTLKVAEDEEAFICRFFESTGTGRKTIVRFPLLSHDSYDQAELVSTLERPFKNQERNLVQKIEGEKCLAFRITLKPFQIITLKVPKL